jgi:integrase/recombinase XerD
VTHLRQLMLEELRRRNYSESTARAYIRTVERFAGRFHCPPDRLGLEHIRQYQAAMFTRWKLAPNTVTQRLAALRFFYIQVLKRGWSAAETPYPYPNKVLHLPHVLSQKEVALDSPVCSMGACLQHIAVRLPGRNLARGLGRSASTASRSLLSRAG